MITQEPEKRIDRIVHEIIGAAIEVHRHLGPGLLEHLYEKALCVELTQKRIRFGRQIPVNVLYKNQIIGQNRLDVIVENEIIVEIKSVDLLAPIHMAQVISYLKCTNKHLGLLINFNVPVLKEGIRRIVSS